MTVDAFDVATLLIAVLGVVLGLVGLVIQWRQAAADRPVVKVRTYGGLAMGNPGPGLSHGESYQFIEVYNGGNRPVTVEDVGFDVAGNATISLGLEGKTKPLPIRLSDHDSQTVAWMPLKELGAFHVGERAVRDAWVRLAGGAKVTAGKRDWSFLDSWGRKGTGGIDNR